MLSIHRHVPGGDRPLRSLQGPDTTVASVRVDEDFPEEWGRTLVGEVETDSDGEWFFSDWYAVVFPGETVVYPDETWGGVARHHRQGAIAPDTVVIAFGGTVVALADTGHLHLLNLYVHDTEYYQFLRLRQVLDPRRWDDIPWAPLRPGQLLHAWDKFHGLDYFRLPGRPPVAYGYDDPSLPGLPAAMSYGGDWYDLTTQAGQEYPTGLPAEPVQASMARLLRAIHENDLAAVLEQLDAGADPNTGEAPGGVHLSFCEPRAPTAVGNAYSPEIATALRNAGAVA